jgi:hypothetical protein
MTHTRALASSVTAIWLLGSLFVVGVSAGAAELSMSSAAPKAARSEAWLVETVRSSTEPFRDLAAAEGAGYGLLHGCVSGPERGAMGVHYVDGDLVGDGEIDATRPEALMYEWRNGRAELVGVEFVVFADAWHAAHSAPPVLGGQLFNFVGAPNRYGIPAFYELHVWAWRTNPDGVFADWNTKVSCAGYTSEDAGAHGSH